MKKRLVAFILSFALLFSLFQEASAARFEDVQNDETALNVAVLRLMGVISGDSNGHFRPNDNLTRAEFCKMVVMLMGKGDATIQYRNRTIFPDVRASHWASRYINYAASATGGETTVSVSTSTGDGEVSSNRIRTGVNGAIIHGQPDGTFAPDRSISFAEAVTILMRVIGYDDGSVDSIWPQGYLELAEAKKLTKGLTLSAGDSITREQAATLFVNALTTDVGGSSQEYVTTLGLVSGEVTLLSVDISNGKVVTTEPSTDGSSRYQSSYEYTSSTDSDGKVQIQSSSESQYTSSYSSNGKTEYKIDRLLDMSEFIGLKGRIVTKNGKVLTFLPSRTVNGGTVTDAAVIVKADGSTEGFDALTGGVTNYAIYKNGVRVSHTALRRYDVATYNPATNAVVVTDTRVNVWYEGCEPSPSAPNTVTILGTKFGVLPTAQQSLSAYHPGQAMTVLLTADGRVAGAAAKDANVSGNAYAYVDGSGKVSLICGGNLLALSCAAPENSTGKVGRISQSKTGTGAAQVYVSAQSKTIDGVLDIHAGTMGSNKLAENVLIVYNGKQTSPGEMSEQSIVSERITYVHLNSANEADVVVIAENSDTLYGRAVVTESVVSTVDFGDRKERQIAVKSPVGTSKAISTGFRAENNDYIEAVVQDGQYIAMTKLTKLAKVPSSAWIGDTAVVVNGRTYTIPETVICWNLDTKAWFTDFDTAMDYGGTRDLYVKDGVVRVIEIRS